MKAPFFWYQKPQAWLQILSPLGWPYRITSLFREQITKAYQAKVPVICVGNLTVGGTGKTPVVTELVRMIKQLDHNPHILLRGYGGKESYVMVNRNEHDARDVGDEAMLLQKLAPTWVGKDRGFTAQLAEKTGACVIIMDDGLQNPTLQKDFNFIVIDGAVGFGNGMVMPMGPLRETIGQGLKKAQAVILIGDDQTNVSARIPKTLPVIRANFELHPADIEFLKDKNIVAFAGIGRPAKFKNSLQQHGLNIVSFHYFADHHFYSDLELTKLLQDAAAKEAILVTTEKDYMRLSKVQRDRFLPQELMYVRSNLKWQKPELLSLLLYPLLDHH